MITEDYVSFETAKFLKEKGFPLPSTNFEDWAFCMYDENGDIRWGCYHPDYYCRVTLQMAMKWLREVHGLFISIGNDDLDYNWQIFDVRNRTKDLDPTCLTESYGGYKKYELACTLAIKYCLKNLI